MAMEVRTSYEMFSRAGNARVTTLVRRMIKLPSNTTNRELCAKLNEGMKKIAVKYSEVYDTAVRECIIGEIERHTDRELSIFF